MGDALDLDKLAIEIRPRQPWEATDLGVLMARRWWWPLTKIWLIQVLPIFLVFSLLPKEWLWLQYLVIWWLKPIFERPLLDFLSLSVFGDEPTTERVFKNFRTIIFRQFFSSLLWRRLSPSRSFDLPVLQLEGLPGNARAKRLSVLHREGAAPASMLTVFGASIETALAFAVIGLAFMFIPNEFNLSWEVLYLEYESAWIMYIVNALVLLAAAMIAPFYVAAGFALYLNRRIDLEGWDIEIAFKNMVSKRQESENFRAKRIRGRIDSGVVGILWCAMLCFSVQSPSSDADIGEVEIYDGKNAAVEIVVDTSPELSKTKIELIKQSEKFNVREVKIKRVFPWDDWEFGKEKEEKNNPMDLSFIADFFSTLAKFGEWLLWALVLFFVVYVTLKYRYWLMDAINYSRAKPSRNPPKVLFGMEVTENSLPNDVGTSALKLVQNNQLREAFALLYRASLAQLLANGADLKEGDTENRCLEKAKNILKQNRIATESYHYFERLTRVWQRFAYGHEGPESALAHELCEAWATQWHCVSPVSNAERDRQNKVGMK